MSIGPRRPPTPFDLKRWGMLLEWEVEEEPPFELRLDVSESLLNPERRFVLHRQAPMVNVAETRASFILLVSINRVRVGLGLVNFFF